MGIKRRVFYSFHYNPDSWRASQVRNIGVVEGNRPATDNDWECVKRGGDPAIARWIKGQMRGKSCNVVLVGTNTSGRKWINYEIRESWRRKMGVMGIYIHGLEDSAGRTSKRGNNPFSCLVFPGTQRPMSNLVRCYNPLGSNSRERYNWINHNLSSMVEEAIGIRDSPREWR